MSKRNHQVVAAAYKSKQILSNGSFLLHTLSVRKLISLTLCTTFAGINLRTATHWCDAPVQGPCHHYSQMQKLHAQQNL